MYLLFSECYTASREASIENAAEAAWDAEQQPAGSDSRPPEADGGPAGAEQHPANAERQAAGGGVVLWGCAAQLLNYALK